MEVGEKDLAADEGLEGKGGEHVEAEAAVKQDRKRASQLHIVKR